VYSPNRAAASTPRGLLNDHSSDTLEKIGLGGSNILLAVESGDIYREAEKPLVLRMPLNFYMIINN
jgi:hypothetical protein